MSVIKEEVSVFLFENETQKQNKENFKKVERLVKLFKAAKLIKKDNNWDIEKLNLCNLENVANQTIYDIIKDPDKEKKIKNKLTDIILSNQIDTEKNGK